MAFVLGSPTKPSPRSFVGHPIPKIVVFDWEGTLWYVSIYLIYIL
jgi:hypothetical protein